MAPTTTNTHHVFISKEDFLAKGIRYTIDDATQEPCECAICLEPLYVPNCSPDTIHDHSLCCSSEQRTTSPDTTATSSSKPPASQFYSPGVRILACGHVFGYACIKEWLRENATCPMCRRVLWKEPSSSPWVRWQIWWKSLSQMQRAAASVEDGFLDALERAMDHGMWILEQGYDESEDSDEEYEDPDEDEEHEEEVEVVAQRISAWW